MKNNNTGEYNRSAERVRQLFLVEQRQTHTLSHTYRHKGEEEKTQNTKGHSQSHNNVLFVFIVEKTLPKYTAHQAPSQKTVSVVNS